MTPGASDAVGSSAIRARAATKAATKAPARKAPAKRTPAKRAPRASKTPAVPANRSATGKRTTKRASHTQRGVARSDRLGSPGTGVLITGGGSGIGRASALALAEVGRPVAIWDLNAEGAEETATLCHDRFGVTADWSEIDVADSAAVEARVPRSAAALGSLGGFVHAAGVSGAMSVDFIDDATWDTTLNINVRAAAMISKALLEPFRAAGPGSAVVLISSVEGLFGSAMLTAYCASKGAVLGVMRSIGQRFAMEGFRVNAVCPGAVATPMLTPAFEIPGFRQRIEEHTPLQRIATPDEIARPIRFLLSDEASFITGAHLTVDGGLTSVTSI
jgi:NAD(P)-dependent dehydrogenase (short-subunit alcohol dehydrogenase family)